MRIYKGDYVERRLLGTQDNSVILVSYSVDHESRPVSQKFARGTTIFGVFQIYETDRGVELLFHTQTNSNSRIGPIFNASVPGCLFSWFLKMKSNIKKKLAE